MNVAIVGAAGRMGAHLIHAVQATEGLELTAAIERRGTLRLAWMRDWLRVRVN